ncbi:MAG: hypothetical protein VX899_19625 [Myxococcota bacterium]|nr:hypothetical protein [Myxococcota bacterium]
MRPIALMPLLLLGLVACNGQGDGEIDPERPERNCSDGTDNDQDGLTDCDDDDCDDLCESGGATEVCDNGSDDDGDGAVDCDDSDGSDSCAETCDDGVDNDADGLVDCDDDECADVAPCWWPETIQHNGDFVFKGRTVTCETWLGDFDEKVDDCTEAYTTVLSQTTGEPCPTCDQTYDGTFNWTSTACNDAFGDGAPTASGRFGFKFVSQDKWVLFAQDDGGTWSEAATMNRQGGNFQINSTDRVDIETGDCDNDPLYVGDLTTTLTFSEG